MMNSGEVLGVEWLPEEVVEMIAEQLTATELASCCAVSVSWRERFGRDRLWRCHYDPALAPCLATSKSVVQPCFLSPETTESTLSAISPSRLCSIREKHLQNNWSNGNFKVDEMPDGCLDRFHQLLFYKNDYLLQYKGSEIRLWNIKEVPKREPEFCFPVDINLSKYCVFSEEVYIQATESHKIVFEKMSGVAVFSLDLAKKELVLGSFFCLEAQKSFSDINDADAVKESFLKRYRGRSRVLGNILVGAVKDDDDTLKLHVWDLESGTKLKEDICPFLKPQWRMCYVDITTPSSHQTKNVLLTYMVKTEQGYRKSFYVYDLIQLSFLSFTHQFQVEVNPVTKLIDSVMIGQYVATIENNKVLVFDYKTSELMYSCAGTMVYTLQNNFLIQNDGVLSLFDLYTKKVVNVLENVLYVSTEGNQAIFLFNEDLPNETPVKFTARKELPQRTNTSKCFISVYASSCSGSKALNSESATNILLLGDKGKYFIVHFW